MFIGFSYCFASCVPTRYVCAEIHKHEFPEGIKIAFGVFDIMFIALLLGLIFLLVLSYDQIDNVTARTAGGCVAFV